MNTVFVSSRLNSKSSLEPFIKSWTSWEHRVHVSVHLSMNSCRFLLLCICSSCFWSRQTLNTCENTDYVFGQPAALRPWLLLPASALAPIYSLLHLSVIIAVPVAEQVPGCRRTRLGSCRIITSACYLDLTAEECRPCDVALQVNDIAQWLRGDLKSRYYAAVKFSGRLHGRDTGVSAWIGLAL